MADQTLTERLTVALAALGALQAFRKVSEYIHHVFSSNEPNRNSAARGERGQQTRGIDPEEIEAKLGLTDPRKQPIKTNDPFAATDAALFIRSVDQETVGRGQEKNAPQDKKVGGVNAKKASEEITIAARNLGALTAPVVASIDGRVEDDKLAQQIHKVAETNTEGAVTAKVTTAFDVTQENNSVKETVETVHLSTAEERLQELQEMVIATKGENLDVLMQYGNALHAKVYGDSKETGFEPPTAETIGQYANAINLIKKYQENETTRTMQPA
jgi:hypothetical protein